MHFRKSLGILAVVLCMSVVGGCSFQKNKANAQPTAQQVTYSEVRLGHDGRNTVPQTTTLAAGENYKFIITPESNGQGCMSTIKREGTTTQDTKLVLAGEPVEFTIPNAQPGEYKFVCNGMGMEQGKVVIEA